MAAARDAMSPPPFTSPGVSASASASEGSSWGVGLFLEFFAGLLLGFGPYGVFVDESTPDLDYKCTILTKSPRE